MAALDSVMVPPDRRQRSSRVALGARHAGRRSLRGRLNQAGLLAILLLLLVWTAAPFFVTVVS